MITITTEAGIIEMPCPQPDDAESIKGNCEHGVSLFSDCLDCRWLAARVASYQKPHTAGCACVLCME